MEKVRATRHNGRTGSHGIYTTKHNDRRFPLTHAKHIDPSRTHLNVYWDWQNGLRTDAENKGYPSFDDVERAFYAERYAAFVAGQNARNAKTRHPERNRTTDELHKDTRFCPEETIFQFGRDGQGATPEQLRAIFEEFSREFAENYSSNIHMLDWAMHMDETTVHIQERHCFDYVNKYGEVELKQEKALEALGIPLPDTAKPPGRFNNRKITFDAMNRLKLIDIAKKHGLEIEEQVKYGGKQHLEKQDYIIAAQMEKIAELQKELQETKAELETAESRMAEVDSLIDAIADVVYEEAVGTVADTVAQKAEAKAVKAVDQEIKAAAKASDLNLLTRGPVKAWLNKVRDKLSTLAAGLLSGITAAMLRPETRKAVKGRIREGSRERIADLLKPHMKQNHYKPHRDDGAR